jgi:hypothetical protein
VQIGVIIDYTFVYQNKRMKNLKILTLALGIIATGFAAKAQTADEVVQKYVKAMGGADKLKASQTQYTEGVMIMGPMEIPLKRWVIQDKAMRLEFSVNGTDNIQVVTKNEGWQKMPIQREPTAKPLDKKMLELMQPQLDISGELYNYKAKGKKIVFLGKEAVDGVEMYKLNVINSNGTEGVAYINAATNYIVKTVNKINVKGADVELVTLLSDYKTTPDGYVYPATTAQTPSGIRISINKVEMNKPIPDSLFVMPK